MGSRQPAHSPASASGRPSARHPIRLADGALALPLVERVDRDDAPPPLERLAEGRARRDRLGPGVEHPRGALEVGRPVRDEAPAIGRDRPAVLALDHDEGVSSVGATLYRAPSSSASGSAAKISASSDAGRSCVNRPHMAASLVSSARWTTPGRPPRPIQRRTGRLTREEASALLAEGDARLAAGDLAEAAVRYSRVVGYDDPAITAAALLGLGEARFRAGEDDAAVASWEAVLQVGETPSSYPAWRNIAAAAVRTGDLHGAIDAYRQAERRAPPDDKPRSPTASAGSPRRPATRTPHVAISPAAEATAAALGDDGPHRGDRHRVADRHPVGRGPVPLRRVPARQGSRGGRRVLAPVDGDARAAARSPASSRLAGPSSVQHVRPVPVRADRRTLVRPVRFLLFYLLCAAAGRSQLRVRWRHPVGRRVRRDLRPVRSAAGRRPDPPPSRSRRAGARPAARDADPDQHALRVRRSRASTTPRTSAGSSPGCGSAPRRGADPRPDISSFWQRFKDGPMGALARARVRAAPRGRRRRDRGRGRARHRDGAADA